MQVTVRARVVIFFHVCLFSVKLIKKPLTKPKLVQGQIHTINQQMIQEKTVTYGAKVANSFI